MEQAVRLQDHPGVARLNGRYTSYTDSGHIGITTVFEDEFYIWVPPNSGFEGNAGTASADYGLRVVRLKDGQAALDPELYAKSQYQTLRPSRSLHDGHDVRHIAFNNTGEYVLLICTSIVYACRLPARNSRSFSQPFIGNTIEPIIVGRRFNIANPESRILSAQWHPLSRYDTHVLILSDDSVLRLYNLSDMKRENGVLRVDRAEQSFNVYARDNYAQAVTFAMSRDTSGWARMSVHVLLSDASIVTLCPVLPRESRIAYTELVNMRKVVSAYLEDSDDTDPSANAALQWVMQVLASVNVKDRTHEALCNITSPPMFVGMSPARIEFMPPDQLQAEPCSLVILSSVPAVAGIGFRDGTVRVCCLLEPIIGRWDEALEAPRQWLEYDNADLQIPQYVDGSVYLQADPLHTDRFHAYHCAGVHRITCPSVPLLEQYMAGEGGMPKLAALEVHELLCTMVNSDELQALNPVIGLAAVSDLVVGYFMIALQLDGSLTTMKLWHTAGSTALITGRSRGRADDQQDESFQEPDLFDEISAKLKSSELAKLSLSNDIDDAAKLRFLKDTIKRYREDRVKKLYEAAALLADRKEQVRMRTVDQERKLAAIEGDLAACEQAVGDILVKAEAKREELRAMCDALKAAVASTEMEVGMSGAEKAYMVELKKMCRTLKNNIAPGINQLDRRLNVVMRMVEDEPRPIAAAGTREEDITDAVAIMQRKLERLVADTKQMSVDFKSEVALKGTEL